MVAVQEVTAPVKCQQNTTARVVFNKEQILNGEHRNFLETFQLIFEADRGAHHLILIHKMEGEDQVFSFPEIAYELYQALFLPYHLEMGCDFPGRPFYPVFGTNEDFNYWRELLGWDLAHH